MGHYVHVRQQYLASPSHSSTAQARTVLVTGIPQKFLTESALTRLFSHLPGGVRKVWINRDLGDMPELYKQRLKACQKLESAATSLLNKAIKRHRKRVTNPAKSENDGDIGPSAEVTDVKSDPETRSTKRTIRLEELVSEHERPTHRLPLSSWIPFSIPLLGKKVDTIEWACERIHELNTELAQRRGILARDTTEAEVDIGTEKSYVIHCTYRFDLNPSFRTRAVSSPTYPPADGAFILFNNQTAAHMAAQAPTRRKPYCMPHSLKYVEATNENVIWENLALTPHRRRLWLLLSWTVGIVLIMIWMFPGKPRLNLAQPTSRAKTYI